MSLIANNRKKVFIIFDHVDYNWTPTQRKTKDLVDRIVKKYGEKCEIKKYMEDYIPGSKFFKETERLCKETDITCIIMSKESIESNMLDFKQDVALIENLKKDNRLVILGIDISKNDIPTSLQTKNNKLYENFESVGAQQDIFLDRIFLPGLSVDTGNKYPIEESAVISINSSLSPESVDDSTISSRDAGSAVISKNSSRSPESVDDSTISSRDAGIWRRLYNQIGAIIGILFVNRRNFLNGLAFILEYIHPFNFTELLRRLRNPNPDTEE